MFFLRALALLPALLLGLVGCATLPTDPNAADLLDAPTTLNLGGRLVQAQAQTSVRGETLDVRVKLRSSSGLPPLQPTNVYLVTGAGVWNASLGKYSDKVSGCQSNCALLRATGPANGLRVGQGVEVVVGLRDLRGRTFLLRDGVVQVR